LDDQDHGMGRPKRMTKSNSKKSNVRARGKQIFAHQKDTMNLAIRSTGIKRAKTMIIMASNLDRW